MNFITVAAQSLRQQILIAGWHLHFSVPLCVIAMWCDDWLVQDSVKKTAFMSISRGNKEIWWPINIKYLPFSKLRLLSRLVPDRRIDPSVQTRDNLRTSHNAGR
jgi:hypothetical protein